MADSKKLQFSTPSILNIFHENFILVSRLVGLNDAKGIDVAHPIWLWVVSFLGKRFKLHNLHMRDFWPKIAPREYFFDICQTELPPTSGV